MLTPHYLPVKEDTTDPDPGGHEFVGAYMDDAVPDDVTLISMSTDPINFYRSTGVCMDFASLDDDKWCD